MDYLEQIKDALKVLGAILTLSATPDDLVKGVVVTAVLLIVCMLWKLLKEIRGWREVQTFMAKDLSRLTVDTKFLVTKHCQIHEKDALELLKMREQSDAET